MEVKSILFLKSIENLLSIKSQYGHVLMKAK